jgi:uncharacterized membrane protein YedE/YeeE
MSLRDTIQTHAALWLAAGGFIIGFAFGAHVTRTNFCTMGALSDIVNIGDWRRMRAWALAAATAIVGAQILDGLGIADLSKSMYLAPRLTWFSHLIGGFMFGFGMIFAGGCASRNLSRAGGGDLRALMTLIIIGLFAFMAIGGILGPLRSAIESAASVTLPTSTQSLGDIAARLSGASTTAATRVMSVVVVAGLLAFCFKSAEFRKSPLHLWSGVGVGLAVIAAWALTGLAFDELASRPMAPVSLTFVRPAGDAIDWLERYTAGPMPGFGVATVFGAIAGSFMVAKLTGRFRVTTFANTTDTRRTVMGAILMGIGGVLALGCTIGQGVTGLSTLAIGSFLTFASIVAGGLYGLKVLERWLMAEI